MTRSFFAAPAVSSVLAAFVLSVAPAAAQPLVPRLSCDLPAQPAASLLLPYFEVDLEDPNGRTTLVAVGNAFEAESLVRAVVWTNWGNPAAAFDFFVEPGAVRTLNLRDVLAGTLPETRPPAALPEGRFASCSDPVELPDVDPAALRRLLTGQPDLVGGLCHGAAVEGDRLATGYLTFDVVNDCSGSALVTPLDPGYFGDCGSGLAANDNVVWGDFFLVDPASDHAKGERLVAVTADQTRFGSDTDCVDPPCGVRNPTSFWDPRGNRMPLPSAYESRFLQGAGFDGGTELIVWVKGRIEPRACSGSAEEGEAPTVHLVARSERGVALGTSEVPALQAQRLRIGGDGVPVAESFGCLEVSARSGSGHFQEQQQLWVMPMLEASGRFSVGMGAIPIRDFCW